MGLTKNCYVTKQVVEKHFFLIRKKIIDKKLFFVNNTIFMFFVLCVSNSNQGYNPIDSSAFSPHFGEIKITCDNEY